MFLHGDEFEIMPNEMTERLQAWLPTICHESRQRTVPTRSRSSADCTTGVLRTWRIRQGSVRDGAAFRSTTLAQSALLTLVCLRAIELN